MSDANAMQSPERTDDFWVSPYNFEETVSEGIQLPSEIKIMDSTLRDGEQTPGVVFDIDDKIAIARMLDKIGVERMEIMPPIVSKEEPEAIEALVDLNLKTEIFCPYSAGRKVDELNFAASLGVDGICIPIAIGQPRKTYEHPDWSENDAIKLAVQAVSAVKEKGLKAILTFVDTSRSRKAFLEKIVSEVSKTAPPDAFTITDTTGCMLPKAAANLTRFLKQLTDVPIEIHTHNDLGLGLANALAAIEAGAEIVDVCVNGLGERGGNVSLDELITSLHFLYGRKSKYNIQYLTEMSKMVAKLSKRPVPPNKPVVGDGIFCRESGMAINLVEGKPLALFCLKPEIIGQKARVALGKKSGLLSVEYKLSQFSIGKNLDREQKKVILGKIKELSIRKKAGVTDDEFRKMVADIEN